MDIWLTKDRSTRANHVLQSSQPITSRLNWQTTNHNTRSSTYQAGQRPETYNIYWRFTVYLTLMMTSAQVVETSVNVISNSPSQDYTHPDDHNLPTSDMTPRFKPFTVYLYLFCLWQETFTLSRCFVNYYLELKYLQLPFNILFLLFQGQLLLDNLVDIRKPYEFEVELSVSLFPFRCVWRSLHHGISFKMQRNFLTILP